MKIGFIEMVDVMVNGSFCLGRNKVDLVQSIA